MPIELRPGAGSPGNIVELLIGLDELAPYGVNVEHKALAPARKAAERVREIRAANDGIRQHASGGADNALTKIAEGYARGDLTPEDVPERVGHVAALANGRDALGTVLDRAEAAASRPGIEACRKLSDKWVTEVVRPGVETTLARLTDEVAEAAWPALHMPAHELARDRTGRDALDVVRDAIKRLDAMHDFVTRLRNAGLVPTPRRRAGLTSEDFRWRHHDRLGGNLGDYEAFFTRAVLNGAEPGSWTGDELLAANPSLGDGEPPKPSGDAHTSNAGRREVVA